MAIRSTQSALFQVIHTLLMINTLASACFSNFIRLISMITVTRSTAAPKELILYNFCIIIYFFIEFDTIVEGYIGFCVRAHVYVCILTK